MKHLYLEKQDFYSSQNMEDITDADYKHIKSVWGECGIKNVGEYHELYSQSDKFLLSDVFRNFRNKLIKIHELHPASFLSEPG